MHDVSPMLQNQRPKLTKLDRDFPFHIPLADSEETYIHDRTPIRGEPHFPPAGQANDEWSTGHEVCFRKEALFVGLKIRFFTIWALFVYSQPNPNSPAPLFLFSSPFPPCTPWPPLPLSPLLFYIHVSHPPPSTPPQNQPSSPPASTAVRSLFASIFKSLRRTLNARAASIIYRPPLGRRRSP